MSGGSHDYAYAKVEEFDACSHHDTALRRAFSAHLKLVAKAMRDIEWVDSCDDGEGTEVKAIKDALGPDWKHAVYAEVKREAVEALERLQDELKRLGMR
jgi:hypothetical protein